MHDHYSISGLQLIRLKSIPELHVFGAWSLVKPGKNVICGNYEFIIQIHGKASRYVVCNRVSTAWVLQQYTNW